MTLNVPILHKSVIRVNSGLYDKKFQKAITSWFVSPSLTALAEGAIREFRANTIAKKD